MKATGVEDAVQGGQYLMGFPEIVLLRRLHRRRAGPPLLPHRHAPDVIEFIYVAKGWQTYAVGAQRYDLQTDDILVIHPGETHSSAGLAQEPGVFYWISIRLPKNERDFMHLPAQDATVMIRALRAMRTHHFRAGAQIREYLDATVRDLLASPNDTLRRVRIRGALLQLLAELIDCATRHDLPGSHPWNREVSQLIEDRLCRPLDIAALARSVNMSPQLFTMRFKERFHLVPSEYVMRRKIERAKTCLAVDTDRTVTKIAMDLGFASSSHFATSFMRYAGLSPRAYRRQTSHA